MDRETLKKLIRSKFPGSYNDHIVDLTIDDVYKMDLEVQKRTFKFLETGEIDDIDVEGYTIRKLVAEMGLNVLGAFIMQDLLVKDPDKAKKELRRGFDRAIPIRHEP